MCEGQRIKIAESEIGPDKPIYIVSVGKAAAPMSVALNEVLGLKIKAAILSCQDMDVDLPANWSKFHGGHPLPNEDSIAAAAAASRLLRQANAERANVIFAISGGGSAMIEYPIDPRITLMDLREANRLLVVCGATITEVNTVRRAFSAVKGGKLAAVAPEAQKITLLISDTNRGDEASVASGPSLPVAAAANTAWEVICRYHLEGSFPESILRAVRLVPEEVEVVLPHASHLVLADNATAMKAAAVRAEELGFRSVIAEEICEQPIDEGCAQLLCRFETESAPVCLISGGEFSCPVRGAGRGGRNSETVLRAALTLQEGVILSAGTDGIDGNSPAAGAIADKTTILRSQNLGLEPSSFLESSDSYGFFERIGDAIVTGPTGTNVRDLRILLKQE